MPSHPPALPCPGPHRDNKLSDAKLRALLRKDRDLGVDKKSGKLAYACRAMAVGGQQVAAAAPGRKLLSNSSAAGPQHAQAQPQAYSVEEDAHSSHEHGHQHGHQHALLSRKLRLVQGNSSAGLDPLVASGRRLQQLWRADLADPSASSLPTTGSKGVPLLHR